MRLTDAGSEFLIDARLLLASAHAARRRVAVAAPEAAAHGRLPGRQAFWWTCSGMTRRRCCSTAASTSAMCGCPSTRPGCPPMPGAGRVGWTRTLEHVAAGRGISFLARSAAVLYWYPDISYVPVPDLAPDQERLAVAASRTSPVVDDFCTAAHATAEITAERDPCGVPRLTP